MMDNTQDTITAIATATGRAGVGIVRISGPKALNLAKLMLGFEPKARFAHYGPIRDLNGQIIDEGIALYFPGPNSFTGEDVLELQGHGGPVILDLLLKNILDQGIRMARPGEFSERAFLNDKLDLVQAEAIADLIDASSVQAAQSALRSLQGVFSARIDELVEQLIQLRIYVEAAIDFPEEEIDFLADGKVAADLQSILNNLDQVFKEANRGTLMQEGMKVVIAGRPNAGKSSLLNALAGRDTAIVTEIAGTTRDVLREHIHIDGMPLHIIDTAGLRESPDEVERIGIERAWQEINQADLVLMMVDSSETESVSANRIWPELMEKIPNELSVTVVRNKIDLTGEQPSIEIVDDGTVIRLSAQTEAGIDLLRNHLKSVMGFENSGEGSFMARRRHLDALQRAQEALTHGQQQLADYSAGELLAEDLKLAQNCLGEITGEFSSDELLGRIFSSFCIGK